MVTHMLVLFLPQAMIQLEGVANLSGLVQSFDQQQLANFCRILSVTVSEPDVGNDDKHTLLAKNAQQKRNASPSRAEVNQGRTGIREHTGEMRFYSHYLAQLPFLRVLLKYWFDSSVHL